MVNNRYLTGLSGYAIPRMVGAENEKVVITKCILSKPESKRNTQQAVLFMQVAI